MNNIVIITFNEEALSGQYVEANLGIENDFISSFGESFQYTPRYEGSNIQVWDPDSSEPSPYTSIPGEYTASRYAEFFELDYAQNGFIIVSRVANSVRLELTGDFEFFEPTFGDLDISYSLSSNNSSFSINSISELESDLTPCLFFGIDFDFTSNVDKIKRNGFLLHDNWSDNEFFDYALRGQPTYYEFTDYNGNTIRYPEVGVTGVYNLSVNNISVVMVPGNNGVTVILNNNIQPIVGFINQQLQWSLDGVNYIENNVFSNQQPGSYTVFGRDQFGCVIQFNYNVESNINGLERKAYHYISEANSINFVLQEETDNCSTFKNQINSFDYESLNNESYCENALFNLCDKPIIQLKTNYSNLSIKLRKENINSDDDEFVIPYIQRTDYLNRFESLDGWMYNYGNGFCGVYFSVGNTYDELGVINGSHELNGNMPLMSIVDNLISIDGLGNFIIQDILYDENVEKNVFIIQNNFLSSPQQVIVSSTFNILPFNVFEFEVGFEQYGVGLYDVVISLEDDDFEDVFYVSENIEVLENHEDTVCIIYWNENNRDIFYKFGIKHLIRVRYLDVEYDVDDNVTINVGDFSSELVSSSINKKDKYLFEALPENRRITLIVALSREFCFINGIGYIKKSNVSLDHIKNTNMAYVEQDLIRTNSNYNNNNQNNVPDVLQTTFNIPEFINTGSKFIKK